MTREEAWRRVERVLGEIAPEAELGSVVATGDLREQLDLDSMDFLNFVVGLRTETGVEIPESDYPKLATLDGVIAYLMAAKSSG